MSKSIKLFFWGGGLVIVLIAFFQWFFENNNNPNSNLNPDTKLVGSFQSSNSINNSKINAPTLPANTEQIFKPSKNTQQQKSIIKEPIDTVENYDQLVTRLTSNGLSDGVSNQLFVRSDYVDIINSLEKTNSQSYEVQQLYVDMIDQAINSGNLDMVVNTFNCSDNVCGGNLFYENDEQINAFINETFNNEKSLSVAYKVQPVIQNGIKELRVIFNYKVPVIEVHSNG
ncbi:hypothetical protein JYB87_09240 [Shewanella avicenniae]|uniref:Uncharacterized protein n=1 Tax=Shewanella avicenniae TaxID=2814294 RepID=A0ABX7QXI9_9GAMM|nr:hypothetical protein [Shewanella avicenniae]QSX35348.1 hypothetical protein JYB87_09240 [Shewanella avicenniae]